jgi:hypothetical protein
MTHLELRQDFRELAQRHRHQCLADRVEARDTRWDRHTRRQRLQKPLAVLESPAPPPPGPRASSYSLSRSGGVPAWIMM